jgi:hypothetical protein
MRVKVTFRYRADTGEVEVFTVDAVDSEASGADHDRLHDLATADVARVVENNPDIEEVIPLGTATDRTPPAGPAGPQAPARDEEPLKKQSRVSSDG